MKKNQEYQKGSWIVTKKMPHLSKPQAVVLAMGRFGIVMTGSCGLTTVALLILGMVSPP
ncbi:hypothetical protein [Moorena sp. SIO3H5]|uniref:hypothetical protein n=1 Tax=Moorena sp. SIO3H5 TaxID=2607834 RepID=UPI0013B84077|nr:hypothetical protein [Moorena sp. SIO3H5]NEO74270.1 hypothetical protein [Moorena sp. SIO3H5]